MRKGIGLSIIILLLLALQASPGICQRSQTSGGTSGDPVTIEADSISYDQEQNTYHATGNVVITYVKGILTADDVFLEKSRDQARAEGNVKLKSGQDTLEGDRIDFDIRDKTGVAYRGRAFMAQNHFYLAGDRIIKTGEFSYVVDGGAKATTCDGPSPAWQLAGDKLDVTLEGYGTLKHARLMAKGIPVLYIPYLIFPAKTKRQSGLLSPYFAFSDTKLGTDVEIPFFWAISDDMDATLYQRYMDKRGYKQGVEFRYFTSPNNFGTFYGDFMNDTGRVKETAGGISRDWQSDQQRWSLYLNHQTNFDPSFYFRTDIRKVSDSWYFKDFSSNNYYLSNYATTEDQRFRKVPFMGNETLGSLESTARLVKNWSLYNFTVSGSSTDNFAAVSNEATLQKYPEVTLTGVKHALFKSPVNFEFTSIYDYFYRGVGQKGHFYELKPTLSLPINLGGYGMMTPALALSEVMWRREDQEPVPSGKQGNRNLYIASLYANTEVSRVFNIGGQTLEKIRHSIVPELTYTYVPYVNQADLPNFIAPVGEQQTLTYALTNSFMARLKDKDGKKNYREFLRFKLAQTFDIIESHRDVAATGGDRKPFGSVAMEVDFIPFQYLSFMARNTYDVNKTTWSQANYDLALSDTRGDVAVLGYRYTQYSIEEINLYLKAVVTKSFDLTYNHRRNQLLQKDFEKTIGIRYQKQCWSVVLSYAEKLNTTINQSGVSTDGDKLDRTYMLTLNLYGLGTFGSQ
ncbi:MAG: LPS assembly protein LptD [Syntrophales bacterium]|nr:LPS assembly protein LptD [Syntrophales bacterium]